METKETQGDRGDKKTQVSIFVGNGGVGKTTLATLFAINSARKNKKTLLLTIDPSRRLHSILGLNPKSGKITKVEGEDLKGNLYATCIVPEEEFKNFVEGALTNKESLEKLNQNIIYQQITSNLGESQDFTSIYKMIALFEENNYDSIILDTPPAVNSKNFFESPEVIYNLFKNKTLATFLKINENSTNPILNLIKKTVYKALSLLNAVAGKDFAESLIDLFGALNLIKNKVKHISEKSHKLLLSSNSNIYLVSDLSHFSEEKILNLTDYFSKKSYKLDGIFLNRSINKKILDDLEKELSPHLSQFEDLKEALRRFKEVEQMQHKIYEKLINSLERTCTVKKVEDFVRSPTDVKSLIEFAHHIELI